MASGYVPPESFPLWQAVSVTPGLAVSVPLGLTVFVILAPVALEWQGKGKGKGKVLGRSSNSSVTVIPPLPKAPPKHSIAWGRETKRAAERYRWMSSECTHAVLGYTECSTPLPSGVRTQGFWFMCQPHDHRAT